jgi:hypothetical protein
MLRNKILAASVVSISFMIFSSEGFSGAICPSPPAKLDTLSPTYRNVNREAITFFYNSQAYPMEIYTAFAPQANQINSNYCIRYEAINKATIAVEKFYWPLAEVQMDTLRKSVSVTTTVPSGRPPILRETWLYAFLNSAAKTWAYQKFSDRRRSDESRIAHRGPVRLPDLSFTPIYQAAADSVLQYQLKEQTQLPPVGSQFASADDDVLAIFGASWDGQNYKIEGEIERGSEKVTVRAPVIYALAKTRSASDFLGLVRELGNAPLPYDGNTFKVSRSFSAKEFGDFGQPPALYVINQPITLAGAGGRACFKAPMYSPMPVPENLLQCRLF